MLGEGGTHLVTISLAKESPHAFDLVLDMSDRHYAEMLAIPMRHEKNTLAPHDCGGIRRSIPKFALESPKLRTFSRDWRSVFNLELVSEWELGWRWGWRRRSV